MSVSRIVRGAGALAGVLALSAAAAADRVDFVVYENANNTPLAGWDVWVDVLDAGGGKVDFVFHNDSTISASIASLYFESAGLGANLSNGTIHDQSAGVDFSAGATPPNPAQPGASFGGNWSGNVFAAGANSPPPFNGINHGGAETLTVRFDIANITVPQLVAGMLNNPAEFRIAMHVIDMGPQNLFSVWAVVPPPGTAMLAGLAGLVALKRRR